MTFRFFRPWMLVLAGRVSGPRSGHRSIAEGPDHDRHTGHERFRRMAARRGRTPSPAGTFRTMNTSTSVSFGTPPLS